MKKAWQKLNSKELLSEFIAHGTLVLLGCGFLLLHVMTFISKSVVFAGDIRIIAFSIVAVFAIILLSAISLYKISSSYIRWHKRVLDSIPMPVIITDEKANWQQINKAAYDLVSQEFDFETAMLNSKHLIDANGDIMEKIATQQGVEYQIIGSHLQDRGEDTGYLIALDKINHSNSYKTRAELISEINRLLKSLGTATNQFHDCASDLVDRTTRQAGIIHELTDVITSIALGDIKEVRVLSERIHAMKLFFEQNADNNQVNIQDVTQTVKDIGEACDCIDSFLHEIDSSRN